MQVFRKEVGRWGRIKVTEALLKRLSPHTVLELGAGDFSFDYLAKAWPGCSWKKADLSAPADIICDLNAPAVQLPVESESQELVIATEILEHLLWPQAVLQEAHRVLAPDGRLVVSVPNCVSASYRASWLLGRIPSCAACGNLPQHLAPTVYQTANGSPMAGHVIDFNRSRLEKLLRHSAFKTLKLVGSGVFWHRQLLPSWLVPAGLASNLLALACKEGHS